MDIHAKLEELNAFADLIKVNVDVLKRELADQEMSKKQNEINSIHLLAAAKAKRAKFRIS